MYKEIAKDENGHVKLDEATGLPLYIDDKGAEVPVDAAKMYTKIIELGNESKERREKSQELAKKFSIFDDVEDVEKWHADAVKAMETVANFDEKDWLQASKVESMKQQMKDAHATEIEKVTESFRGSIEEKDGLLSRKDAQIRELLVSNMFASSPLFVGEKKKTILTPDAAEAIFGPQFKVEETKEGKLAVRGYYVNGDPVYSRTINPGEPAEFNEAIELIFDEYPNKNNYIAGGKSGTGSRGGKGGEEEEPETDIAKLEKQYQEALDSGKASLAITLKNRIHTLRTKAA